MGTGVTTPLRSSSFGGNEDFKPAEGACGGFLGKPVDETVSFIIMMYSFFVCVLFLQFLQFLYCLVIVRERFPCPECQR